MHALHALALIIAAPATAQIAAVTPPPAATAPQAATALLAGTPVPLRMIDSLTTQGKKLKAGDRFKLEVAQAVSLDGVVVIPAGSPAVGEVTGVRNKGMFGKSGHIDTRLLYVRANGRQIRLSGVVDDKGRNNGFAAGVATYATLVGGFLVTGTSARIPAGAPVTGYLDEDTPAPTGAAAGETAAAKAPAVS